MLLEGIQVLLLFISKGSPKLHFRRTYIKNCPKTYESEIQFLPLPCVEDLIYRIPAILCRRSAGPPVAMGRKLRLCSKKYRDWPKECTKTQTSPVHDIGMGTSGANEVSGDTSSEDLPSIVSESVTSEEQSPSQELSTISTLEHTPKSDMNISGESSVTSPESDVSVSGVDDHTRTSSSDKDIQFKVSVDALNLPSSWHRKTCADSVCFYKLVASTDQPPNVSRAVNVNVDGTWKVYVHNHALSPSCESLKVVSKIIADLHLLKQLIELVDGLRVCAGHPDANFVPFCLAKKGKFTSKDGEEVAYVDSYLPISLNGENYLQTVRTNECELLVRTPKCAACKKYRKTIRILYNRWKQRDNDSFSDSSCHTNNRYLNTPEKLTKLKNLRMRSKTAEAKLKQLRENVNKMIA